jgi:hypothetical protein
MISKSLPEIMGFTYIKVIIYFFDTTCQTKKTLFSLFIIEKKTIFAPSSKKGTGKECSKKNILLLIQKNL